MRRKKFTPRQSQIYLFPKPRLGLELNPCLSFLVLSAILKAMGPCTSITLSCLHDNLEGEEHLRVIGHFFNFSGEKRRRNINQRWKRRPISLHLPAFGKHGDITGNLELRPGNNELGFVKINDRAKVRDDDSRKTLGDCQSGYGRYNRHSRGFPLSSVLFPPIKYLPTVPSPFSMLLSTQQSSLPREKRYTKLEGI